MPYTACVTQWLAARTIIQLVAGSNASLVRSFYIIRVSPLAFRPLRRWFESSFLDVSHFMLFKRAPGLLRNLNKIEIFLDTETVAT